MFAAVDAAIIAACISLAGVLITTGWAVMREVKKMGRTNTADHGEVITTLRTVVLGQEQLYSIVDRHIEQHDQHDNPSGHGGPTNIYRKIS
jgi:hypothetical protein